MRGVRHAQRAAGKFSLLAGTALSLLAFHPAGAQTAFDLPERTPGSPRPMLHADVKPLKPVTPPRPPVDDGLGQVGFYLEANTLVRDDPHNTWTARDVVAPAGLAETYPDAPLPEGTPLAKGHAAPALLGRRYGVPTDTCTHALASATGFVSTPSDLVRFFGQLATTSPSTLLSFESRREIARPLWRIPGAVVRHYGLGTAHGETGGWTWFGHGGGFPGVRSFTVVVPEHGIAVSVCLHATDGDPQGMVENILRILQVFATNGPADPALADWAGRYWSLWGASDFVPMGNKVLVALPNQGNPFADGSVLTPTAADSAVISEANGYGSFGQTVKLIRDVSGTVSEILFAGSHLKSQQDAAAEAIARYET